MPWQYGVIGRLVDFNFTPPLNPFLQILPFDTAKFVIYHKDFETYGLIRKPFIGLEGKPFWAFSIYPDFFHLIAC